MHHFKPYKNQFVIMLYLVVFIIFFGLSMYLVTMSSSVPSRTVQAVTP